MDDEGLLNRYFGKQVVLDMSSSYAIVGTLVEVDHRYLVLAEADVHDLRDSTTTREMYVLDIHRHGLSVNRTRVCVPRDQVVGLSALADVRL